MLIVSRSKVEQSTLDDLRDGWLGGRPIFGSKNGASMVPFWGLRRRPGFIDLKPVHIGGLVLSNQNWSHIYMTVILLFYYLLLFYPAVFTYSAVVVCNEDDDLGT